MQILNLGRLASLSLSTNFLGMKRHFSFLWCVLTLDYDRFYKFSLTSTK
jgi:hypothetical protein